jgi:phosphoglycolate phosphatase-like HAD superfamily hydrolase
MRRRNETLQLYSGLDGAETLKIVAPSLSDDERKKLLEADGKHYERTYLPSVTTFDGVREVFTTIKVGGGKVAIATDCKGPPLKIYRSLLGVDDLIDQLACGEDVDKGKPDPGLVQLALEKLGIPAGRCVMIGDTPYDCKAAKAAGAAALGLLSGGFAREELLDVGALDLRSEIRELELLFAPSEAAAQRKGRRLIAL